jgi:hypothetical protein
MRLAASISPIGPSIASSQISARLVFLSQFITAPRPMAFSSEVGTGSREENTSINNGQYSKHNYISGTL